MTAQLQVIAAGIGQVGELEAALLAQRRMDLAARQELEGDVRHCEARLRDLWAVLDSIRDAADHADNHSVTGIPAGTALRDLIQTIRRAVPGPSDPGSTT